jgi:hypothetical protein
VERIAGMVDLQIQWDCDSAGRFILVTICDYYLCPDYSFEAT